MTVLAETLPSPTRQISLEAIDIQVARIRAGKEADEAQQAKDTLDDFTPHGLEPILSPEDESRLGAIALGALSHDTFVIPPDEN